MQIQKRYKSMILWIGIIASAFLAVGIDWQTLTSWNQLGNSLYDFVLNPSKIILFGVTIYGVLNNPTNKNRF